MADFIPSDSKGCHYFFLYDGSKVRGEGDPTKEGICYFYPEETAVDKQELLCGQLAGVCRCISELSFSPTRLVRLRRNKFAIHMQDDFFWALGCSMDIPTVTICRLLHQLINLFCFYNGCVRQSYQLHSHETLAAHWSQYLAHLLAGPSELHRVFSSMTTIDSTNVDPLLLLKAALILQACQRCPLVLAGCILFRGRVVSTQMSPHLTMKIMVHESETYKSQTSKGQSSSSSFSDAVSSRTVFLTMFELQYLQSVPVDKQLRFHSTPIKEPLLRPSPLSRTSSDTSECPHKASLSPGSSASDDSVFGQLTSQTGADPLRPPLSHRDISGPAEEEVVGGSRSSGQLSEDGTGAHAAQAFHTGGTEFCNEEPRDGVWEAARESTLADDSPLIPMTLYLHRVKGLVLALLVEPHFLCDKAAMEEVHHSCLASLNGLEAHLRTVSPGAPATAGPYVFAHLDCAQSTLMTNMSAAAGGGPQRPFVRAASLLHSHFCSTETLQEAIIRNASAAIYGTRNAAQETYFLQHGAALRNSGIPNHQDSAFSLPAKTRHRLLKHGVNLL
ncbi:Hermansky-Pudlak syndrome 4 protein [Entelurus aequoreus]|uniref:Hermansky-Pudlak syndrome 4 protein n=1 Tax=Entelurus aequoreus TaxID=161455 RepID=UPI002B1D3530|nr:Hermansky-Pudlak syndrome 4 protein [Entelurus aequoreus]